MSNDDRSGAQRFLDRAYSYFIANVEKELVDVTGAEPADRCKRGAHPHFIWRDVLPKVKPRDCDHYLRTKSALCHEGWRWIVETARELVILGARSDADLAAAEAQLNVLCCSLHDPLHASQWDMDLARAQRDLQAYASRPARSKLLAGACVPCCFCS